jgi:membrane protein
VKFLIRKSKKILVPGFRGIPLFDVIRFFFQQVKKTGLTERASSISFNLVMAIPPACIFLFTLIPFLPVKGFIQELYQLIRDTIPGQANHTAIIQFLQDFLEQPRGGLLSFGFIVALYFSSSAMIGIMRSFNKDYIGFRKRTILQVRGVAIMLTLVAFLLLIVAILALISRGAVLTWFGVESPFWRNIILNTRWIIFVLLFYFLISFIYRYAPAVHKKWKFLSPGAILSTFLMIVFTTFFSYWVTNFNNYNRLYGSISTI